MVDDQGRKRLTVSATQAGLSDPSTSTVTRTTTWTPPLTSSTPTISPRPADPAVDPDRRREPHLVEPDVHAHGRAVHGEELGEEQVHQRQREVAVGDGCAVAGLRGGPLDVDVDPLVVARGVGEQVDLVLRDLDPVGRPEVGAVEAEQLDGAFTMVVIDRLSLVGGRWSDGTGGDGRSCPRHQACWLETGTTSPVM